MTTRRCWTLLTGIALAATAMAGCASDDLTYASTWPVTDG
jgi:hypothetical protein